MFLKLVSIVLLFSSCNYFIRSKSSQLYYEKSSRTYVENNFYVIKFNPIVLAQIIQQNPNKKYFVIGHCNPYCSYTANYFKDLSNLCNKDTNQVYFIPLVYDYLNDIKNTINDTHNFNSRKEIYVTDGRYYGKGINPNLDYQDNFLSSFTNVDSIDNNLYGIYKDKIILIQTFDKIQKDITTIEQLINKSDFINIKENLSQ